MLDAVSVSRESLFKNVDALQKQDAQKTLVLS